MYVAVIFSQFNGYAATVFYFLAFSGKSVNIFVKMSDKWETVTKPKSGKSSVKTNGNAGSKAAAKKLIEKAPKLEDVCEYLSIYLYYS